MGNIGAVRRSTDSIQSWQKANAAGQDQSWRLIFHESNSDGGELGVARSETVHWFAFACGWSANCQNVSTIFKLTASGCNGSSSSSTSNELNRQTDTGAFRSRKTVAINCIKVLTRQQPPPPTLLPLPPSGGKNNGELLCKPCNNKNHKHES